MTRRHLAALLLLLLTLPACPSAGPPVPPLQRAMRRVQLRTTQSWSEAVEAAESQESYAVRLRYNPARCETPPHEVYARGMWIRAYIDAADEATTATLAQLQQAATRDPLTRPLLVTGRFDAALRADARRVRWPVFRLMSSEVAGLNGGRHPLASRRCLAHRVAGPRSASDGSTCGVAMQRGEGLSLNAGGALVGRGVDGRCR